MATQAGHVLHSPTQRGTFIKFPMATCPFSALAEMHVEGYVTLCTIQQGKPRARTVLFQGFFREPATNRLALCIKASVNSNKVRDRDSDEVEIVSWNNSTMVQMRFAGKIIFVDSNAEGWLAMVRLRVWDSLGPGGAQSQFYYDHHTGLAKSNRSTEFMAQHTAYQNANGAMPPSFAVGVLYPESVDFLDLSTCSRMAWTLAKDGSWSTVSGFAPPVVSTIQAFQS